jgi:hypothetical protein
VPQWTLVPTSKSKFRSFILANVFSSVGEVLDECQIAEVLTED